VVKGTNLGPENYTQATGFPLPPTVGGTSITVTVGSSKVNAILFSSLASQVAAILPSKTPTGTGTVTVTYSGQSVSAPVIVVQNNIGIFTVDESGTGDAIAFLNADNGLITPAHAANPGDIVVLWGTGLGPVTSDETQPAVQADMPSVPLQVFIGGQPAEVLFHGRNACCSSIDTVYLKVPDGITGCAVPVIMQIGGATSSAISNTPSIAIANTGRTCTRVSQYFTGTGTHTYGVLSLDRFASTASVGPGYPQLKQDGVAGDFYSFTFPSAPLGSQMDVNSYGSCTLGAQVNGQATAPGVPYQLLDAGATIELNAPFENYAIPIGRTVHGDYSFTFDHTATTLALGQYTFSGTGGTDVGPLTATYTMPPLFVWTDQMSITAVNRTNGITVNWSGGDPAGYVTISGASGVSGPGGVFTEATFSCAARVSDGSFTVPAIVLLALPPTGRGALRVTGSSGPQLFGPPAGVEWASVASVFEYETFVVYQ
jgi:uncharacterized protein (TIGR03437 family)